MFNNILRLTIFSVISNYSVHSSYDECLYLFEIITYFDNYLFIMYLKKIFFKIIKYKIINKRSKFQSD